MAASLDGSFGFKVGTGASAEDRTCTISGNGSVISVTNQAGEHFVIDSSVTCVCTSANEVGFKFKFKSAYVEGSLVMTGFQSITPTFEDGVVHFGGFTQTYYSP